MPIVLDMPIGKYPQFNQATEDIKVYKVVFVDKYGKMKSMFYQHHWSPVYKMRRIGVFTKLPGRAKNREYLVSNEGLYSFTTLRSAKRFKETFEGAKGFSKGELIIMEATIPRDSMYLQQKEQIISNQLWLNKEHES